MLDCSVWEVSLGARIAERFPLDGGTERDAMTGIAAIFVVTTMAISPAGSVYTVTAPSSRVELPVGAYPLNCSRWFNHSPTAQRDYISRPPKINPTLFPRILSL